MEGVDRIQRTGDPERTGYRPHAKMDFQPVELFKVENARRSFFNIQHSEFTLSPRPPPQWPLSEPNESTVSQEKGHFPSGRGTESGTPAAQSDAELAQIVGAWPGLTDDQRRAIVAVVEGSAGQR
jgi:hypothetical protein